MEPYYEDAHVTIYHGDCRDVLPDVGPIDLVLTDPPYGIGSWSATGGNSISPSEAEAANKWDAVPPDELLISVVEAGSEAVVWGANYLCGPLGPWRTPLVWDKRIRGMHFADGEIAWTNFKHGALRIFVLPAGRSDARGNRAHPTQKPVDLFQWCIKLASEPDTVLDPFMGVGTALLAAKNLDCRAIGIELEEKYCEIAAERCTQGVLDLGAA